MPQRPVPQRARLLASSQLPVCPAALAGKGGEAGVARTGAQMLVPIKRSKYPALSEEEETMSLPLQTLAGAIFDGILVHMLNTLAPQSWQVREE